MHLRRRRAHLHRPFRVGIALSLLVGGLLGVGTSAGAATDTNSVTDPSIDATFRSIPDSSTLSGPASLTGTVLTEGDFAADATVLAFAWPSNVEIDRVAIGSQIPMVPIARTKTRPDGTYQLRVPVSESLRPNENEDGSLNVTVMVYQDGRTSRTSRILEKPVQTATGNYADAVHGKPAPTMDVLGVPVPEPQALSPFATKSCITPIPFKTGETTNNKGIIGQTFSNTSYVEARVTYQTGSASDLGVAISFDGTHWQAQAGVTRSINVQTTTTFPTKKGKGKYFYITQFRAVQYTWKCQNPWNWNQMYDVGWESRPTTHFGGATVQTTTNLSNANTCVPYQKGAKFKEDKAVAITWSNGFSITAGIVKFSVSSHTGYSTTSSLEYTATKDIQICGKGFGPAEHVSPVYAARPL